MASRTNATLLMFAVAVSAGNGAILQPLSNLLLNTIKSLSDLRKDRFLNFTELSGQNGFATEEHTVTTEDGYILTVYRMRRTDCVEYTGRPVLLMHGLFQDAVTWLDAGPDAGLAYLIAGQCHELWVGNQRGNYDARRHVRLDPDRDAEFWQFSVDEIGFYDIPATVDYVLKSTKKEKLNYVGFSQGGGTFVIMCSERPSYCDKVNMFIALAPATRNLNTKSVAFRSILESFNKLEGVLSSAGVYEVFARGALVQESLAQLCKSRLTAQVICGTSFQLLDSPHPGSIDDETLQSIATHTPAGTSVHNLARYGQGLLTDKFQKFDYGKSRNVAIYGTERAPIYNVSAVTVPVVLFYGLNDGVVDTKDVLWLVKRLPRVEVIQVAVPLWNHFDMTYSPDIKEKIFTKFMQYL